MVGLVAAGRSAGLLRSLVKSSIGKKLVVGLTGFCLCGFLMVHLGGNLLLYKGGDGTAFNHYAEALASNPLVIPAELILAALFISHIGMAIKITLENRKARPDKYAMHLSEGGRTLASRTMIYSGLIVLAFLILHLIQFRFDGAARADLYTAVGSKLSFIPMTVFYLVAVVVLGTHVSHGLQSAFRTLGLVHPRYTPIVIRLSQAFGAVVAIGFGSMPIWALVTK